MARFPRPVPVQRESDTVWVELRSEVEDLRWGGDGLGTLSSLFTGRLEAPGYRDVVDRAVQRTSGCPGRLCSVRGNSVTTVESSVLLRYSLAFEDSALGSVAVPCGESVAGVRLLSPGPTDGAGPFPMREMSGMISERQSVGLATGVLWTLVASATLGCIDGSGQEDGPCVYEDRVLEATDPTPWGGPVVDDIATLSGPYPGNWTWAPNADEIENAEQVIEVEAVFEVDEDSYRISEYVDGGVGVACLTDAIQADGILSFIDAEGATVASVPVTVKRGADQSIYTVHEQLSPIASFSDGLTALVQPEQASIRVLVDWGLGGGSPIATFEYVGQTLGDSGGFGFQVGVAEFR